VLVAINGMPCIGFAKKTTNWHEIGI
jgi:hypothetical protein